MREDVTGAASVAKRSPSKISKAQVKRFGVAAVPIQTVRIVRMLSSRACATPIQKPVAAGHCVFPIPLGMGGPQGQMRALLLD